MIIRQKRRTIVIKQSEDNNNTLTFSVSHHQHSMVDHPGVAEDLQRVRYTLPVELQTETEYILT